MTADNTRPAADAPIAQDEVDRLIEQFDPESNFRRLVGLSAGIASVASRQHAAAPAAACRGHVT